MSSNILSRDWDEELKTKWNGYLKNFLLRVLVQLIDVLRSRSKSQDFYEKYKSK